MFGRRKHEKEPDFKITHKGEYTSVEVTRDITGRELFDCTRSMVILTADKLEIPVEVLLLEIIKEV